MILAIDPGTKRIGMVIIDEKTDPPRLVRAYRPDDVDEELVYTVICMARTEGFHVVVERVQAQGVAGASVIETADQAGYIRGICKALGYTCHRMYRREVKRYLDCAGGKDADVAARVREIMAGTSDRRQAVGTKKAPGPCYGLSKDAWQAAGLALAWLEMQQQGK